MDTVFALYSLAGALCPLRVHCILTHMQKFILIMLVLGLGFFLYLLKSGEVDSNDFNVRNLKNPIEFVIKKVEVSGTEISSTIYLNIYDQEYKVYTFTGSSFDHIPRSQYYEKRYDVPLEAKDAVTGTWLGSRYIFYVTQEGTDLEAVYKIYKAEYPTDSTDPVEYQQIQSINGFQASGRIDVRY